MTFLAVDLGTTNIKAALFDAELKQISTISETVQYIRKNSWVEFTPDKYFSNVVLAMKSCIHQSRTDPLSVKSIILTGQGESLIMLDAMGNPVHNGISWLDERSWEECSELKSRFPESVTYPITGQPSIIPTWPITKILWLKKNKPDVFKQVSRILMLKDYIQYRLTGKFAGEYSIYNFTHYFDIRKKAFWEDILDYCGVKTALLPELVEPCTDLGPLSLEAAESAGLSKQTTVNVGTLDHFAGMIGTGNIKKGIISESTGTVLSLATMLDEPLFSEARIPCHYGPFKDSYVLLPLCESGGISLEWFKNTFAEQDSFDTINRELEKRNLPNALVFLPYIAGVNSPDFNPDASGVFFGISLEHDRYDFAYAVMEGVACLLKKNLLYLDKSAIRTDTVISTGGGARSGFWSQLKADITGYTIAIPENEEAACLGAAIIGAVEGGIFSSYKEAVSKCVSIKKKFIPCQALQLDRKYQTFEDLYEKLLPVFSSSRNQ